MAGRARTLVAYSLAHRVHVLFRDPNRRGRSSLYGVDAVGAGVTGNFVGVRVGFETLSHAAASQRGTGVMRARLGGRTSLADGASYSFDRQFQ